MKQLGRFVLIAVMGLCPIAASGQQCPAVNPGLITPVVRDASNPPADCLVAMIANLASGQSQGFVGFTHFGVAFEHRSTDSDWTYTASASCSNANYPFQTRGTIHCSQSPTAPFCSSCSGNIEIPMYSDNGKFQIHATILPKRTHERVTVFVSTSGTSSVIQTDEDGNYTFSAPLSEGTGPFTGTWTFSLAEFPDEKVTRTISSGETIPIELSGTRPCPFCPHPVVGTPIDVTTGNVWVEQADGAISGVMGSLGVSRRYDSIRTNEGTLGVLGLGWYHSLESRLEFPEAGVILLRTSTGEPMYFQDNDNNGTFLASIPFTERSQIVSSAGIYTRTSIDGTVEVYDSGGRLQTLTDLAGRTRSYTRDFAGRLIRVSDPGGRALTFAYDASGKLATLASPSGVLATYSYDAAGLLSTVNYSDGTGYRYTYDEVGRLLAIVDFSGRQIETHTYDGSGRGITSEIADGGGKYTVSYAPGQATVVDGNGNQSIYEWEPVQGIRALTKVTGPCSSCGGGGGDVQRWAYDSQGHMASQTDANGKTTTFAYDSAGNLTSETNALNQTRTYTYDSHGRRLTTTGPDTATTTATYGNAGPLTVTDPINRTTTLTYNPQGLLATITDPRTKTTTLAYNGSGDLTGVSDPLSHSTIFVYDADGRRTTATDGLSHVTTTAYTTRGQVTRVTSHDGTHTDFAYDEGGRRTRVTDPLGRVTQYTYDANGRLDAVIDAIGGTTRYGYDIMGNLTSLTDAKGNKTAFEYDSHSRVKKVIYPGGAFETFVYDAVGRLSTKTDRKTVTTTYSYDDLGRLTGKTYSDGTTPPVSYSYDTAGRLATAANGTDTLTWTYDLAGQLLSEQSSKNASTVAYTYDDARNRLTVSLDGTLFVSYGYDDASRLTTITHGGSVFGFGYDNANRRTSMTYPNGVNTSYSYDNLNRLLNLSATKASTTITNFTYTYDTAGNRTRKALPDYSENYSYDALHRLTRAERTGSLLGLQAWSYDAIGNRLTNQQDSFATTSSYNERNQPFSSAGGGTMLWRGTLDEPGTVSFTSATINGQQARMLAGNVFEANLPMQPGTNNVTITARDTTGNVTTRNYSVDVSGTGAAYTFDADGNLAMKTDGGDSWAYTWDAENKLSKVEKNGSVVASFKYDPLDRRVEKTGNVVETYAYAAEDVIRRKNESTTFYIHGPGFDEPVAQEQSGVLAYSHADGIGSVVASSDVTGQPAGTARFDVWGQVETSPLGVYAFTGREWDPDAQLYFYRARWYSAQMGRFISEDPIGFDGGLNLYAYVRSNPVRFVDPLGTYRCTYDIAQHYLQCFPTEDPNHPGFADNRFASGRNRAACTDCVNNPDNTDLSDMGPVPQGNYFIGQHQVMVMYQGSPLHGRRLTPNPHPRYGFFIHECPVGVDPSQCGTGCITTYPAVYNNMNNILALESTNTLDVYDSGTYSGPRPTPPPPCQCSRTRR